MTDIPAAPPIQTVVPDGWGIDAFRWLSLQGLAPRPNAPIRSSSFYTACEDPFLFYLTEILGLCSPFAWSKPLSRGSWAHKRLEFLACPDPVVKALMNRAFEERCLEIRTLHDSQSLGAAPEGLTALLEREEKDFKCAWGWFEAASSVIVPPSLLPRPTTFKDYLLRGSLRLLCGELLLSWQDPRCPGHKSVIRIDQLYYDESTNNLWILDYKTCDEGPRVRLASCAIEFQTQHYLYVLQNLLKDHHALLASTIPNFPERPLLGGMIHLAQQKPTIDFGMKDRPFRWVEKVLTRGPRKGLVINEKEYTSDEPSFDIYLQRCSDWYKGEGEYADQAAVRMQDPPVNISFTPINIALDDDGLAQYSLRLSLLTSLFDRTPYPANFVRNPISMRKWGKVSPFAPFYVCPPFQWPDIIQEKGLIQKFRDDHIDPNAQGTIEWQTPNPSM